MVQQYCYSGSHSLSLSVMVLVRRGTFFCFPPPLYLGGSAEHSNRFRRTLFPPLLLETVASLVCAMGPLSLLGREREIGAEDDDDRDTTATTEDGMRAEGKKAPLLFLGREVRAASHDCPRLIKGGEQKPEKKSSIPPPPFLKRRKWGSFTGFPLRPKM